MPQKSQSHRFTPEDLKDETLFRLNNELSHLHNIAGEAQKTAEEAKSLIPKIPPTPVSADVPDIPTVADIESITLADVGDIPAAHRANFGEGTPGGIENPRYTIDEDGIETVGLCLEITPPNDANFHFAQLFLDVADDGEALENKGNHGPVDGAAVGAVYYAVIWHRRPSEAEDWAVIAASVGYNGAWADPNPTNADTKVVTSISAIEGVGYPTIGTILEEGMLAPGDVPHVLLTIPYTAPSSGQFTGFTVFWSTDGGTTYTDEAFHEHAGGADGAAGTVYRNWPKPSSNETWTIVLSPHTEWDGHKLLIASDERNKGTVDVESPGAPAADGITDASVVSTSYLTELDDYGNPTFACQIQWTNPSDDSNFYHSELTVQLVDSGGTGEPTTLLGDERVVGGGSGPGVTITRDEGPWGPVGLDTYNRFRLRLYCVNRLGVRTLQTTAWGGNSAYDIVTSSQIGWPTLNSLAQQGVLKWDLPYVAVTFDWDAASSGSVTAYTIFRSIDGGKYEAIMNLDAPNGADGVNYTHDVWLEKPSASAETWEFVMAPHTAWDGHRLWIGPGNINYDSIVVQPAGPPADFGTSAAASVTDSDVDLAELDAYGWPTFAIEVSWTHPTADSNFFHSKLTVQLVDAAGNPAPGMLGDERHVGGADGPGLTITQNHGPWGPAGHPTYNRFRLRLYFVGRLGDETLQATAWGGAAYYDFDTSGASGGLGGGLTKDATTYKLKAATTDTTNAISNPGFEDGLEHWTVQTGTITVDTGEYYSGSQSAKLTHGSTDSQMYANPIRVAPGQKFYVGAYVKATSGTVRVFIQWFTEGLSSISFTDVGSSSSSSWGLVETTGEAPATASWAYIVVDTADAAGTAYVDNVFCRPQVPGTQIQDDAIAGGLTWTAERNIKLATADLTNGVLNPGFEDGLEHWDVDTGDVTVETSGQYSGNKCVKLDNGSDAEAQIRSDPIQIRPGEDFFASAYLKATSGVIRMFLWFTDTADSGTGYSLSAEVSSSTWTEVTASGTAPASTAYVRVYIDQSNAAGVGYADSVLLRRVISNSAELKDGVLADAAKFGTNVRPLQIVSSLPTLPDSDYPSGQAVVNTGDGKLYRNNGGTWTSGVDQLDVSAVYAAAVIAGLFDGHSLKLDDGTVTTEVRNLYDSIVGEYAGARVKNNSTGQRTVLTPGFVDAAYSAGTGRAWLYAPSAGGQVAAQYGGSSAKQVMLYVDTSTQAIYINNTKVVGPRATGWSAPTGTLYRGALNGGGATLSEVSMTLAALISDLQTHGLIGT